MNIENHGDLSTFFDMCTTHHRNYFARNIEYKSYVWIQARSDYSLNHFFLSFLSENSILPSYLTWLNMRRLLSIRVICLPIWRHCMYLLTYTKLPHDMFPGVTWWHRSCIEKQFSVNAFPAVMKHILYSINLYIIKIKDQARTQKGKKSTNY
jgi:hypothetical protein